MTSRFMMSVAAAALIAGTGFANAQGTMGREAPSAGSTAQPSAPSSDRGGSSAATMNRNEASDSAAPAEKSAQSDEKMQPPGGKNQHAQDMKAGPKGEKSAQSKDEMKGEKSRNMSSENNEKGSAGKEMKADSKSAADSRAGSTNTENRTTGNAATSATAAPPAEKRTQIASAIKQQKVEEVSNVNFNISVGTAVPATVHFYPLPAEVVEIYPEWRGYDFILVHGEYIIIRPQTREIVYIIES